MPELNDKPWKNAPPASELIRILADLPDGWRVSYHDTRPDIPAEREYEVYSVWFSEEGLNTGILRIAPRIEYGTNSVLGYAVEYSAPSYQGLPNRLYTDAETWYAMDEIDFERDPCWFEAVMSFDKACRLARELLADPDRLTETADDHRQMTESEYGTVHFGEP